MKRVLIVALEPPWPTHHGGRAAEAGLAIGLAARHHVEVLTWDTTTIAGPVPVHVLEPRSASTRLAGFFSSRPRVTQQLLGSDARRQFQDFLASHDADAVVYTHSTVAAALSPCDRTTVTTFANIEYHRYRSFAAHRTGLRRLSALVEAAKAFWWEPRVAAQTNLSTALNAEDQRWIDRHAAHSIVIPLGTERPEALSMSPASASALYLASMDYQPNFDAARWLIDCVWPLVRERLDNAQLLIAGRASGTMLPAVPGPGITVIGEVQRLAPIYRKASLVLAPVVSGAGQQMKVTDALAHSRTVVATPYSTESVPTALLPFVTVAATPYDFATATADLLADNDQRWLLEQGICMNRRAIPTWIEAVEPLATWIEENA